MAKDFVVASTKKEAIYSKKADLTIEDNLFDVTQDILYSKRENFILLWRLFKDQYEDNVIDTSRLKKLYEEITIILENKNITIRVAKLLRKLKIICGKGVRDRKKLYGFGD